MIHSVFVAYDGSPAARAALRLGARLASPAHGKLYMGYLIEMPPDPSVAIGMMNGTMEYLSTPTLPPSEEAGRLRQEREAYGRAVLEDAAAMLHDETVTCEALCLSGDAGDWLARAPLVDLIALGRGGSAGGPHALGRMVETALRTAIQPVLVSTADSRPPEEIVVLFDGRHAALHALAVAVGIACDAGLPLSVATACASEGTARSMQQVVGQYLSDHGLAPTIDLPAPKGCVNETLIDYARGRAAALVVMGAFGESRVREWLAGSTTRAILAGIDNPVILVRR
jgi:nucleotide-binding universal stress UspA family protein